MGLVGEEQPISEVLQNSKLDSHLVFSVFLFREPLLCKNLDTVLFILSLSITLSVLMLNQQALTAEVIKTIRDIISLNPLYKEFLAQLVEGGKRVADNPVHLADFGREAAGFY